jgi:uncharacterized protein (DUF2141 family)
MKKIAALLFMFSVFASYCFSQTVNITVEVTNVAVNGGKVYLAIFASAEEFRKEEPSLAFDLGDGNSVLIKQLSLPPGDYVISAFQDENGNQKLDYGMFGVPREMIGLSNYFGRGLPTKIFDRQKITVNSSTGKVVIGLYRF